jgi:hypothetical protein
VYKEARPFILLTFPNPRRAVGYRYSGLAIARVPVEVALESRSIRRLGRMKVRRADVCATGDPWTRPVSAGMNVRALLESFEAVE